jgi:threonyl-tRNA synthetase
MQMEIRLPDGAVRRYETGTTAADVAESISPALKKKAVAAKVNGRLVDLEAPLERDAELEIVTLDSKEGLQVYRHSAAHVLAQAVKRIYGDAAVKLGIGPVIEDGFYYDIKLEGTLSPDDLGAIEREMETIVREKLPIRRRVVSREEAGQLFARREEPLKLELLRELPDDAEISIYEQGEFADLCRGPHLPSTEWLKAFKLQHVAGAYWRGDAAGPVLQRIYGTAFPTRSELAEHLALLEEAKQRDHRKLGKELGLFMFSEEAPGMPFFLPKGYAVRNELEAFERAIHRKYDYQEVRTPIIYNQRLWEQSGHLAHYRDNMYFTKVDDTNFALKPMNCPGHYLIYKNELHSYRQLPIRLAEFGQVHRHEFSGALNGMMRVRTFCQDDAHLFVRPDQIKEEISRIIDLIAEVYAVFGFTYTLELSTRPDDSMGDEAQWAAAEQALREVLADKGIDYRLNSGDGAFYGPKIDFHILDALKRSWQCGTIQLDYQNPEKFDLNFIDETNGRARPVIIHRALYGSVDRFVGILTEHYAGRFPTWLAPVQAKLLPVSPAFEADALRLKVQLERDGIRVETDLRSEKLGYKIREAQLEKIPYMLVLGENELRDGTLSVRSRDQGDLGALSVEAVVRLIADEAANRR